MPELAEVEYFRRQWMPGVGAPILAVDLHPRARIFRDTSPSAIQRALPGTVLHAAESHGKQLLFAFTPGLWLTLHLGMSGQLLALPPAHTPDRHDHLVLRQKQRSLVFRDPRMFGHLLLDQHENGPPPRWTALPPAVLSARFTTARLTAFLQRHARAPLKAVLLDQSAFPGIGNWMADEILWRGRFDPALPCGVLAPSDHSRLRREIRSVARNALRVIAPDWGAPPDSWLFNHRWRDGQTCPRPGCGAPLIRETLRGRTTCWCGVCQKS